MSQILDLVLHLDRHLHDIIVQYGALTYLILFLIVFCETGLVVTPILPGDSLLFAAGTFAASGMLDIKIICILLTVAAILGDTVNYACGQFVGPRVFRSEGSRFLNRQYLEHTHRFYVRHGGKTIILARFVPIVRTFAPFVAGVGRMPYARFVAYNIVGAVVWVLSFTYAGYAFGNIRAVRENFTLVMLGIVFVSVLPAFIEYARVRLRPRASQPQE